MTVKEDSCCVFTENHAEEKVQERDLRTFDVLSDAGTRRKGCHPTRTASMEIEPPSTPCTGNVIASPVRCVPST